MEWPAVSRSGRPSSQTLLRVMTVILAWSTALAASRQNKRTPTTRLVGSNEVLSPAQVGELTSAARQRYVRRVAIQPSQVAPQTERPTDGLPDGCRASSPCGLWVERQRKRRSVCRDLCVDTEYLPAQLPASRLASAEVGRLRRALKTSQFPSSCSADRLHPLSSPKAGLGVTLHYAAHHLLAASATGAVFAPHQQSLLIWSTRQLCGQQRSLQCYFQPLTHCSPPSVNGGKRTVAFQMNGELEAEALRLGKSGIRDDFSLETFQSLGSVWALAHTLHFLWQPQPWLQRAVERARGRLAVLRGKSLVLGVHVRHGDACVSGRECYPWAKYRTEALRMREMYGVRRILLATDSAEIARECVADTSFICSSTADNRSSLTKMPTGTNTPQTRWQKTQPKSRNYIENRILKGELDGGKLALAALVDLTLIGECDMFIGTFSSSFSRLAFLLIHARRQRPVPYISLDTAWGRPDGGII